MEGCSAEAVQAVEIGASPYEDAGNLDPSKVRRLMERRGAGAVLSVAYRLLILQDFPDPADLIVPHGPAHLHRPCPSRTGISGAIGCARHTGKEKEDRYKE